MFGVTFLRITIKSITNDDRGQLYGLPSLMAASLGDSRQPGSKAALLLLRTPTCLAFRMEITNDDLNEYTSATFRILFRPSIYVGGREIISQDEIHRNRTIVLKPCLLDLSPSLISTESLTIAQLNDYNDNETTNDQESTSTTTTTTSTTTTSSTTTTTTTPKPTLTQHFDYRDSRAYDSGTSTQYNGYQAKNDYPPMSAHSVHKWQSLGTRESVKETRSNMQQYNKNGKTAQIKDALQYAIKVSREGSCQWPRPRVIPVRDVYPSPSTTYIPHCAILHRCSDDTGCCRSEALTCVPKHSHRVELSFYSYGASRLNGNRRATRQRLHYAKDKSQRERALYDVSTYVHRIEKRSSNRPKQSFNRRTLSIVRESIVDRAKCIVENLLAKIREEATLIDIVDYLLAENIYMPLLCEMEY
ncbi:calponin homology domain-containing protein -like [Vespula maculifrons]|uniref:Calponin homology domain-containing protein -like n=1 Tax=Vespula maculifrons TaxID=7453 RepID=A0ABD2BJ00_VESMC